MDIPQEIIDKIEGYVIDNATLPAVRSQLKNRILFGYYLRDDEVAELKYKYEHEVLGTNDACAVQEQRNDFLQEQLKELKEKFLAMSGLCDSQQETNQALLKRLLEISNSSLVWDYSDIAIKFKHWIPEREFENENAAFSEFFEEVYNRK